MILFDVFISYAVIAYGILALLAVGAYCYLLISAVTKDNRRK